MANQITPNPSVPSQVVQEVKFPKFVNNLGIIPTSYKDSMSYYECLAWLCKYLEETVIPTVNENGEAVEELQGLYIELNSYVDNYFDTLDVQEEINNKLDDLVEDGTLESLIGAYIQPRIDAQNEVINLFKNNVNNEIDLMNTKIDATTSGSPLVASSTSGMTNTARVYVNTTDGKWYYYDGTNWTAGGVYQATAAGANSVSRSAINYSLTGTLFSADASKNKKINISYNSSTTTATVSLDGTLFFDNGNGFYTVGAQTISETIGNNPVYLILDVSSTPTLQLIEQADLTSADKGSIYTLGYIYAGIFYNLTAQNKFNVSGFNVLDKKVQLCTSNDGYIKLDQSNNSITFSNVFVLENTQITGISTTLTASSALTNLHYITWNGTTVEIHQNSEKIDHNRILFTIYANRIFGTHNITIINEKRNPIDNCAILLGDINVSFTASKIYINNIYIATPGLRYSNYYANVENVVEISIPDTNPYNLYFVPTSGTFELLSNQNSNASSGKWWILTIYANKVFPIIDASKIKVNGVPYYETVLNVQTNAAIELSMNDIFKKLADKSSQTKITIVGDSIAQGQGGTGFNQNGDDIITVGATTWSRNPDGYCWANIFKDYIEDNYNAVVTNNACTGTDTSFLATNISTLIPSDSDIVIICYGTNNRKLAESDNYSTVYSTTIQDFNTIIAYCNTNSIKYCICSPIPSSTADEEATGTGTERFVHLFQINNIIKSIASTKKVEYADMYNAIKEYCYLTDTTWTSCLSDGLHPNDTGYKILFYQYMFQFGLGLDYVDPE